MNQTVKNIVDRLRGVGPGADLGQLLTFYINNPAEVPQPLVHSELVKYEHSVRSELKNKA